MKMKFEKWLKAFLRTEQKYHQVFKKLTSPGENTENLYGIYEGKPVPDKEELSELYKELEKAEKESKDNHGGTSHDKLIQKIRKDLEKHS